jgi:hypothetical protein
MRGRPRLAGPIAIAAAMASEIKAGMDPVVAILKAIDLDRAAGAMPESEPVRGWDRLDPPDPAAPENTRIAAPADATEWMRWASELPGCYGRTILEIHFCGGFQRVFLEGGGFVDFPWSGFEPARSDEAP